MNPHREIVLRLRLLFGWEVYTDHLFWHMATLFQPGAPEMKKIGIDLEEFDRWACPSCFDEDDE